MGTISEVSLEYPDFLDNSIGRVIIHKKRATRYKILHSGMIRMQDGWYGGLVYQDIDSKIIYCRALKDFDKENWLLASS
ncbi:hypothetical protein HWC59_gp27 [Proteus phage Myduc]|uniref:Uncharacterized protein n=1 Tax=Proteus phage Myduc TaxID=2650874 RepID=A0A5J6T7C3_9CAUD|nr:hypothetical protein HWC59_gp27 [Proteus phage Myduc]QFG06650.1 hypothetical protein CPT_Myduc_027 [Proteus phage Myduc]